MDKQDFEKVKKLLEGEGFSVNLDAIEGYAQDYVVRVGKKDKKVESNTKVIFGGHRHFGQSIEVMFDFSKFCDVSGAEIGEFLREKLEEFINEKYN